MLEESKQTAQSLSALLRKRSALGKRVEAASDCPPIESSNVNTQKVAGVRWARDSTGEVATGLVRVPKHSPILYGNGQKNRLIRNVGLPIRYTSKELSVTLHSGDVIWVPQGEPYIIEPLGNEVECEIVIWPVQADAPLNLSGSADETQ